METVQQNGRFTLFSSKFHSNIYSILFGYCVLFKSSHKFKFSTPFILLSYYNPSTVHLIFGPSNYSFKPVQYRAQVILEPRIILLSMHTKYILVYYNRWQRRIFTLSVQLYSDVTSVNLVLMSDKIINNSDKS